MATNHSTVIGRETRIKGRVTGTHDIEVLGHVEGEVAVQGDVRVDAHATIAAPVSGKRITVRGAIKGDISADEAIALEEGARVVGDLRAPRIAIAQGGLLKGYVDTFNKDGKRPPAASSARHHAPAKPAPKHVAKPAGKGGRMTLSGGKAPRPVVPVLKKGTKAALTKKR